MEMGEVAKNNNNNRVGGEEGECRANPEKKPTTHSTDMVLQWGNRKRLRCMKIRTRVRVVDRTTDSSNNLHLSSPPPLPHRISSL